MVFPRTIACAQTQVLQGPAYERKGSQPQLRSVICQPPWASVKTYTDSTERDENSGHGHTCFFPFDSFLPTAQKEKRKKVKLIRTCYLFLVDPSCGLVKRSQEA